MGAFFCLIVWNIKNKVLTLQKQNTHNYESKKILYTCSSRCAYCGRYYAPLKHRLDATDNRYDNFVY